MGHNILFKYKVGSCQSYSYKIIWKKTITANDYVYCVIRIVQEDVQNDSYKWDSVLMNTIVNSKSMVSYICKNNICMFYSDIVQCSVYRVLLSLCVVECSCIRMHSSVSMTDLFYSNAFKCFIMRSLCTSVSQYFYIHYIPINSVIMRIV